MIHSIRRREDHAHEIYVLLQMAERIQLAEGFELAIEGRRFILDGELRVAKHRKISHGFLFNDMLLLVKPISKVCVVLVYPCAGVFDRADWRRRAAKGILSVQNGAGVPTGILVTR